MLPKSSQNGPKVPTPKSFQNVYKILPKMIQKRSKHPSKMLPKSSPNGPKGHQNAPPAENPQKVHQKVTHFAPTWLPKVTFGGAFLRYFRHVFPMCFLVIFLGGLWWLLDSILDLWGSILGAFFDTFSMFSRGAKKGCSRRGFSCLFCSRSPTRTSVLRTPNVGFSESGPFGFHGLSAPKKSPKLCLLVTFLRLLGSIFDVFF